MQLQTIICTCAHGWYFDFSHQQASVVSSSCQVDLVWLSHNVEQCSQRCWCDSYKGSTSWWPRQPCRQCSSPSCPKHAEEETHCQGDTTGQGEEHKAVAKAAGSPKKPGLKAKFFSKAVQGEDEEANSSCRSYPQEQEDRDTGDQQSSQRKRSPARLQVPRTRKHGRQVLRRRQKKKTRLSVRRKQRAEILGNGGV